MYTKIAENIFAPLLDYVRGTKSIKYLKILRRTQWAKQNAIVKLQEKKLRSLIRHAYENVPFYHRLFKKLGLYPDDIKTIKDLAKLPVITKKDIRINFDDLMARGCNERKILDFTSGSTGEPLKFYVTKTARSWETAAELRAYEWAGYNLGDKYALIWGAPFDVKKLTKLSDELINFFERRIVLNSYNMSEESMHIFASKLVKFKPKIIRGYSSALYLIANFIKRQGIEGIRPTAIITTAEKLFIYERKIIEKAFQCEVFDFYGSREVGAIASECSEHIGHHISAENVIIEFVDDGHVSPNEVGEILVTNLNNYAMPLIRYANGDMGIPLDEECPCGRGLPLIKSIEGRVSDILCIDNGKFISAPAFVYIFKDLPIKQYQLVQETKEKILVNIVKDENFSIEDEYQLIKKLREYLGKNVLIEIRFCDKILPTKSGKRKIIMSFVPIKFSRSEQRLCTS